MDIKSTYILNIFIAYHPKDKEAFEELNANLENLDERDKGYQINKVWFDGTDLSRSSRQVIHELTEQADLVLLLMSDNSILSPFFVSEEMRNTLNQHEHQRSIVIPIILNTCWWEDTVFGKLEVLPRAGLPIYDSRGVKNELFDQVVRELDKKLDTVRARKIELESSFKTRIHEADQLFKNWQKDSSNLRYALPLYEEAKVFWREGFLPNKEQIETKISICYREIDFAHYAKASRDAYAIGDIKTAFFNSKDALKLRNDAKLLKLHQTLKSLIDEEETTIRRAPFDKHFYKAEDFFLSLNWPKALEEYYLALELLEDSFGITTEELKYKIDICRRELWRNESLDRAEQQLKNQRYKDVVEDLVQSIKQINQQSFDQIDYAIRLTGLLENVEAFYDNHSHRWGFYNKENKEVIIAPKYTAAYNFQENLAAVKKWDKWGFIDIEGNEVISFNYTFVSHFKDGLAEVMDENGVYYINHQGKVIEQ